MQLKLNKQAFSIGALNEFLSTIYRRGQSAKDMLPQHEDILVKVRNGDFDNIDENEDY